MKSLDEIIDTFNAAADHRRIQARVKARNLRIEQQRVRELRAARKKRAEELAARYEEVSRELARRVRCILKQDGGVKGYSLLLGDDAHEWMGELPEAFERWPPGQKRPGFVIGRFGTVQTEVWIRKHTFDDGNGHRFYIYEKA